MIMRLVKEQLEAEPLFRAMLAAREKPIYNYQDLLALQLEAINKACNRTTPYQVEEIVEIDPHPDWSGTLALVFHDGDESVWATHVSYGSCSYCDAMTSINDYSHKMEPEMVSGYVTLALHMIQRTVCVFGDDETFEADGSLFSEETT
jgi:hypothetical protein